MTWFDYAVLAIIGISIVLSIIRGMVREVLALASWIIAFLAAQQYALEVAPHLPSAIPDESLRLLAGFLIVFLSVLLVTALIAIALSRLVRSAGLGGTDRALGAVFGVARGLVIVLVIVLLAGLTTLPRHPEWRHAMFSAPFEALANVVKIWLPYGLSRRINYD